MKFLTEENKIRPAHWILIVCFESTISINKPDGIE